MIIKILFVLLISYGLVIILGSFDKNTDDADYLIVLGHALNNNKADNVLIYRLEKATYYLKKFNCKVVLSGGITKNNTISEAQVMKEYLIAQNINESRIILEDKSIDTVENIKNCLNYIDSTKKVTLISSNYHVFRSKMICKLLGLNVNVIGTFTPILEFIKHMFIEEVFIIINYVRLK